jgi:hypothetical protein
MDGCGQAQTLPLLHNGRQSIHSERAKWRREAKEFTVGDSQKGTVMQFSVKLAAIFLIIAAAGLVSATAGVDTTSAAGQLTLVWD